MNNRLGWHCVTAVPQNVAYVGMAGKTLPPCQQRQAQRHRVTQVGTAGVDTCSGPLVSAPYCSSAHAVMTGTESTDDGGHFNKHGSDCSDDSDPFPYSWCML